MNDFVKKYFDLGWPVVPTNPGNKNPYLTDVTGKRGEDLPWEELELYLEAGWKEGKRPLGTALRMPSGVIGLDFDLYKDPTVLQRWLDKCGPLPRSPMSTARPDGSGIRFFKVPEDVEWSDGEQNFDIIKRGHRIAVVEPTIHKELGEPYRWVDPDSLLLDTVEPLAVADLPDLPETWVEALRKKTPTISFTDGEGEGRSFAHPNPERWINEHLHKTRTRMLNHTSRKGNALWGMAKEVGRLRSAAAQWAPALDLDAWRQESAELLDEQESFDSWDTANEELDRGEAAGAQEQYNITRCEPDSPESDFPESETDEWVWDQLTKKQQREAREWVQEALGEVIFRASKRGLPSAEEKLGEYTMEEAWTHAQELVDIGRQTWAPPTLGQLDPYKLIALHLIPPQPLTGYMNLTCQKVIEPPWVSRATSTSEPPPPPDPLKEKREEAAVRTWADGWPEPHINKARMLAIYILNAHYLSRIHGLPHVWTGARWEIDGDARLLRNLVSETLHTDQEWADEFNSAIQQKLVDIEDAMSKGLKEGEEVDQSQLKKVEQELRKSFTTYAAGAGQSTVVRLIADRLQDLVPTTEMRLNTPAGVLDLRTGEVSPHDPEQGHTQITPYDPGDPKPWADIVATVYPDPEIQTYLQNFYGRALWGKPYKKSPNVCGDMDSAKSSIAEGMIVSIGRTHSGGYGTTIDTSAFTDDFGFSELPGSRLAVGEELDGESLQAGTFKKISALRVRINQKNVKAFAVPNTWALIMLSNNPLRIRNLDKATLSRIDVIPTQTQFVDFPTEPHHVKRDHTIVSRIMSGEFGPSALAWAIEGSIRFAKDPDGSSAAPQIVKSATAEAHYYMDPYLAFTSEVMTAEPHPSDTRLEGCWVDPHKLHDEWKTWAKDFGAKPATRTYVMRKVSESCQTLFGKNLERTSLWRQGSPMNVYKGARMIKDHDFIETEEA